MSGGFVSNAQAFNSYYGTGECFVWEVKDKTEEYKAWEQTQSDTEHKSDELSHSSSASRPLLHSSLHLRLHLRHSLSIVPCVTTGQQRSARGDLSLVGPQ